MTVRSMASMNNIYRYMNLNSTQAIKSLRNLSSGYRVNSAADDAAGLAISEKMRGQIGGLGKAEQNAQHAVSMVQTAEGGLSTSANILTRMKELSVQASNGTYSDSDREQLNKEFQKLKSELDRVSDSNHYNGTKLLNGSLGGQAGANGVAAMGVDSLTAAGAFQGDAKFTISEQNGQYSITAQINGETIRNDLSGGDVATTFTLQDGSAVQFGFSGGVSSLQAGVITNIKVDAGSVDQAKAVSASNNSKMVFQIGANGTSDQRVRLHVSDMSTVGLGLYDLDISTVEEANKTLPAVELATNKVSGERANLGSMQNRLEHTLNNLGVSKENLARAESTIRDADMAGELMRYTQRNMMLQASQAMMAQSMNLNRQNIMSLLLR